MMADRFRKEVAVGGGGMLFHRFDWAFEQTCGDMPFPASEQQRWTELVLRREAFCRQLGAIAVTLVIPERHVVYADRLPAGSRPNPRRPIIRLADALACEGGTSLLYPSDTLKATSRFRPTYHLTDQHMTDDGAYACYRKLAERFAGVFGPDIVRPDALQRSTSQLVGDLGIRLDDEAEEATDYLHLKHPKASKIASARLPVGRIDVYEHADSTLPKGVWFGDSHSFALLPFVAEHFSRLVVVHTARFLTDLVEAEQPDLVVSQMSELQIAYPKAKDRLDVVRLPEDGGTTGLAELYAGGTLHRRARTFFAINFGKSGNSDDYCERGWSAPEFAQRWSEGASSSMLLPIPPSGTDWALTIEADPFFVATRHEKQRLAIVCSGRSIASFELTAGLHATVALSADLIEAVGDDTRRFRIEFRTPDAASPADFGGGDPRQLALCFRKLSIHN